MASFSPRSWLKSWRSAARAARRRTRRTAARLHLEPLEERQLLATFLVTNANNAGPGSLRQAILNANSTTALDTIEFRVGTGPQHLAPTSRLPEIINPVILDGTTQPGFVGTPLITLRGHLAGPFSEGLVLRTNNSVVRALAVGSFNGHGIVVYGNSNTIERCHIGIAPTLPSGAANRDAGVAIENGSSNRLRGNVISGNGGSGVIISGPGAHNNIVGSTPGFSGNFIGTNESGTAAVPNGQHGVWIGNGAFFNTIGGGPNRNVISGNTVAGVALFHFGTNGNDVVGNFIGTNASGTAALGNGLGVWVAQQSRTNRIGISLLGGAGNIISGNRNEGVVLTDPGTSDNFVQGNFIGTDSGGTAAVPNQRGGVVIGNGARLNTIGGTAAGTGNVISGNTFSGVSLLHGGTRDNAVQGNYIGTNAAGTAALGNTGHGVAVAVGASFNIIGGSSPAARNVIAANHEAGVILRDVSTNGNLVQGNYIGTNAAGTTALGNSQGVRIALGATNNLIGGSAAGARNLISGNQNEGVAVTDSGTDFNRVQGNAIGTDASGTAPLGNLGHGVRIALGANSTSLGGFAAGQGNVIAFNQGHGVVLWDPATSANLVQGNTIAANADSGVVLGSGASDNTIGGIGVGRGNTIAYNGTNGIGTVAAGQQNRLRGNAIYENGALGIDIDSDGVTFAHVVYLTGASTSGTDTTIEGWVIGAPNALYTVELFASVAADPSGFGEGEFALPGLHGIITDADGYGYLPVTVPFPLDGYFVSATATELDGTTWEFGNWVAVVPSGASLSASSRDAAGPLSPARASLPPPHPMPTAAPDAARALGQAEASRSTPPALPQSHERPLAEGPTLGADRAPLRHQRPDGAAVDAYFGGGVALPSEAPPHCTAAVLLSDDDCLSWGRLLEFDES